MADLEFSGDVTWVRGMIEEEIRETLQQELPDVYSTLLLNDLT